MTKFLIPLLLVTAAAPAIAAPADKPLTFERDGIRYVATVRTVGDTTIISGQEQASGRRFLLRSINGRVTGTYGAADVNYIMGR